MTDNVICWPPSGPVPAVQPTASGTVIANNPKDFTLLKPMIALFP
ncbi:MAG: hypothetical protein R2909_12445 [Gemmatimonadales bacterium]